MILSESPPPRVDDASEAFDKLRDLIRRGAKISGRPKGADEFVIFTGDDHGILVKVLGFDKFGG